MAGPVLISLQKGDPDAGTLILRVETPEGSAFYPRPHPRRRPCWYPVLNGGTVPAFEAADYCEKRLKSDPDLWILAFDLAANADPSGPLLDLPVETV